MNIKHKPWARSWNVVDKMDTNLYYVCGICGCKTFSSKNHQYLSCRYCNSGYVITEEVLKKIEIKKNTFMGRVEA